MTDPLNEMLRLGQEMDATDPKPYYRQILDLPVKYDLPSESYFLGHRDAREAAAEIASHADGEITRLRAENKALRKALAFYADESNYPKGFFMSALMSDWGSRARAALEVRHD